LPSLNTAYLGRASGETFKILLSPPSVWLNIEDNYFVEMGGAPVWISEGMLPSILMSDRFAGRSNTLRHVTKLNFRNRKESSPRRKNTCCDKKDLKGDRKCPPCLH